MKCLAYCSPNWCTAYGTECPVGGVLEKCPFASDDKKTIQNDDKKSEKDEENNKGSFW